MQYNFSNFKQRATDIKDWLQKELSGIRTGKATPLLLDGVMIEAYGSRSELKHVASISISDARSLIISPWDKSQIPAIQKAIDASNLGVSTASDGEGVRVHFPELTGERREALVKIVNGKLEEAKISLRQEREKVWNEIQNKEKSKEISEDEKFRAKDELQKIIDEAQDEFEKIATKKKDEVVNQ